MGHGVLFSEREIFRILACDNLLEGIHDVQCAILDSSFLHRFASGGGESV
jgi:hypothetical protein